MKPIAHVKLLILPYAEEVGRLVERIESGGEFEVVADRDEKGSFIVALKSRQ